ncbi:MAG: rod shape-determining protein MreC [Ruminococcus sp.]|nr:rod shape-determining protein MreC [Ruminococcus sp.]
MREFFADKNRKILAFALAAVIAVSVLGATGNPIVASGFNFLTKGLSRVSAAVTDAADEKTYEELLEENKKLTKEAADLRTQLVDYYDLKDENARLWKYYNLTKSNPDYKILPSRVIRRDSNDEFYSFTIDAGTTSGIKLRDPVLTENGLIGFVSSVTAASSRVTTILSPDLQAGAIDKKSSADGVVSGKAAVSDEGLTTLTKIDANAEIAAGDIVVTSGIGGIYPPNLIVGKVKELKIDRYDATKYAVIKPYEDIKRVTDVVVLTDFKNKGQVKPASEKETR